MRVLAFTWRAMRLLGKMLRITARLFLYLLLLTLIVVLVFRPNYPWGVGWNDISRAAKGHIFNYVD